MNNKKFKISVIIPVYNVEEYLVESIESIIKQTIGFKENIQLILVNDGSPDNSEKICLKYKEEYPENIIYIKQENAGVSVARNTGLKYAEGEYINFLDSDDKWSKNAFKAGCRFLDENKDVDLVCFRLKFFEAKKGYHALDYKFDPKEKEKIIDVYKDPEYILLHANTSIIRKEAIEDKAFDSKLKICEDTKILYEIILEKGKYGAISNITYNYRKRENETSAIQRCKERKYWYIDTIQYAHKYLIDYSKQKFGEVIKYVQFFLMYEIQWRLMYGVKSNLSEQERKEYIDNIKYILSHIDDDVIIVQRNINIAYKLLALMLKYGDELQSYIKIENNEIYINDIVLDSVQNILNNVEIFEMTKENELLVIGNVNYIGEFKLYYKNGEKYKELKLFDKADVNKDFEIFVPRKSYKERIKLKGSQKLEFYIEINGKKYLLKNNLMHFSRLDNVKKHYYYEKGYLFAQNKNQTKIIVEYKPNKFKILFKEMLFWLTILKGKKLKNLIIRMLYWLTKPFIRKNIWLFCDREFMAGDSAEVLFKYYMENNKSKKDKAYFVVDKHYKDYKRMQQYGKVVSYHSLKYKLLFLHSKFLISSHADGYVNNEFGKAKKYYVDLYRFKYIYLTHGILLHDSSSWLNRINKNITLNVVTSPMEYESIINGPYYFDKNQLMKTGMPRYDNFFNMDVKEERKILFMPSWRSTLVPNIIKGTQRREYNPNFKESEYFKFYEKLFSDERLLAKLKEKDLKVRFCIHPSFRGQVKDFKGNEFVEYVIDANSQYETLSSKLIVTDYSSAACDFAYLNKPVIYANFDYDHIYDVHYYNKGYFDYDKHGFGPNCTNYDDFLNELLKSIDNDFKVEDKYESRMKQFFFYRDGNNAKRVYNEIVKLKGQLDK